MPQSPDDTAHQETVMDVTVEQIARVYGQAILGAAEKAGDVAGLVDELDELVREVLDRFPKFEQTLGSALVTPEQKEQLLDRVLGGRASRLVLNFLKVLLAHGRIEILRSVVRQVQKLHNQQMGRVEVDLYVANPLDDDLTGEITTALKQSLRAEPELTIRVDPSLIAGFVVKVGDTVYDGSVKNRFAQARSAIIAHAVEIIETRPETFFNGESR